MVEMTENVGKNDMIIFCGDLNCNANTETKSQAVIELKETVSKSPEFAGMADEIDNEYEPLCSILSGNGEDQLIDCCKTGNNGVSPITYGDTIEDPDDGSLKPRETVLTDPEDLLSMQSLDYIFWIKRRSQLEEALMTS